jgi:predicted transcriptional regulator
MYNTLKEFIDRRGMTVYQFCKDTGLPNNTGYRLYKNPQSIPSGDVLDAILNVYPDARIQDLLLHKREVGTSLAELVEKTHD